MKKTKIVIPALAVLLLSTAASVTGTVAWFSMNNQVTVTGMTVTTKVSSNLQISEHNIEAEYGESIEQQRSGILEPASTVDGAAFYYTTNASGNGAAKPNASDTYKLYDEDEITDGDNPATTDVETTFKNALGKTDVEGQNPAASDATKSGRLFYDPLFNAAYGFNSYSTDRDPNAEGNDDLGNGDVSFAYIDYSFYVKGTYADANHKIVLSKCELSYKNESPSTDYGAITTAWAWRVGMFVAPAAIDTEVADGDAAVAGNLVTILDFEGKSKNQNEIESVQLEANQAVTENTLYPNPNLTGTPYAAGTVANADVGKTYYRAKSGESAPKAVNGTANTAIAEVESDNEEAIVDGNPSAGTTQRYKVIIRLWLEGEDVSCTSTTFANLTRDWKLDLAFRQGSAETPVQYISTPNA